MELGVVWMLFLPRRWRIICFFIVTPWEVGVILTANYTFLNYLVLVLGFLLLDDRFVLRVLPRKWSAAWGLRAITEDAGESSGAETLRALGNGTAAEAEDSGAESN